ncbi:MAG: hypothetical protein AB1632_11685 [Nitrospirota bacterium]
MKRLVIVLVILFGVSAVADAQMGSGMMGGSMMGEQKGEMQKGGMMMGEGMPMMQMCMPMMQNMMMKDMMQMMMDMMNMQESMMKGMKPEEKKKMMKDMGQMKEKMQKMMSMHMGIMTGTGDPQVKLQCAEQWLKKAIDLHELHMKDPKTTTDASQMELMDQIKKAYGCITGPAPVIKNAPTKEPAGGEKKKDAHGH